MSRQSWHVFEARRAPAHLVVAVLQADGPGPKHAQLVLERLLRQGHPTGAYATTIVRESGRPEIFLAFEEERDARTLGDALQAAETDRIPGWMTRRMVELDGEAIAAIAASLPPPRDRSKEPSDESPAMGRRVQSLPRRPIARVD